MKRTTLTASLVGSAAAGLMAAAIAAPAWAQATTYPAGTDCAAISNAANRAECLNQQNESRQLPDNGQVVPDPDGAGNAQPGSPSEPLGAAPDSNPAGNPSTNTPGGIDNSPPSGPGTDGSTDGTSTN